MKITSTFVAGLLATVAFAANAQPTQRPGVGAKPATPAKPAVPGTGTRPTVPAVRAVPATPPTKLQAPGKGRMPPGK